LWSVGGDINTSTADSDTADVSTANIDTKANSDTCTADSGTDVYSKLCLCQYDLCGKYLF
jgi:hypothetical protein